MPGREKSKSNGGRKNNPLGEDLNADRFASFKKDRATESQLQRDEDGFLIPQRMTQKILRTARQQAEETAHLRHALGAADNSNDDEEGNQPEIDNGLQDILDADKNGRQFDYDNDEEANNKLNFAEGDEEDEEVELAYDDAESEVLTEMSYNEGYMDVGDLDPEEERLLKRFQPTSTMQRRNLADMIMEKIRENEEGVKNEGKKKGSGAASNGREDGEPPIDKRVVRVYTAIGTVLKNYTSGKIPKAFKILPNIRNWEQLLILTRPDQWSPHATYQATRIFAANLNEQMAQRFYATVLLPIVHAYIEEHKKLHPSLYMAIRKALFKPVAFFKGFILPLASDEECTLKEALIVASALQKSHLPPLPTAVTIVKIAEQPFSGSRSVFLRVLIDKKMALPYPTIDALVSYFYQFTRTHSTDELLPVLWHQTLLSFTQRYKEDLTPQQINSLLDVCAKHFHYLITPEIRRELTATKSR